MRPSEKQVSVAQRAGAPGSAYADQEADQKSSSRKQPHHQSRSALLTRRDRRDSATVAGSAQATASLTNVDRIPRMSRRGVADLMLLQAEHRIGLGLQAR